MRYYRSGVVAGVLLSIGLGSIADGQTGQPPPVPADLFRKPAGPYAIGTQDYLWVDQSRGEPLTKDPSDRRHLMVQVWYPADSVSGAEPAPYIRNPDEFGDFTGFKPVLHVQTNAVSDAPLAKAERRYPVLVYHHGGSWTRFSATFETEWLASHGYVVVSVDHTGFNKTALFPDGYRFRPDTLQFPTPTKNLRVDALASWEYLDHVFETWVADARFVLDQIESLNGTPGSSFHRRLDLDRIGMLGWSFGGATALQVSKDDPRVKAAVDQDGQLFGNVRDLGTRRPVMLMHNDSDPLRQVPEADRPVMAELLAMVRGWDTTFKARSRADWYDLTIARTDHGHFSDLTLFFPRDTTQLAPQRAHEIINAYTLAFFDRYLRGKRSELLQGPSSLYPEVTFAKR